MNERIKELSEQAQNYAHKECETHGVSYIRTFEQKFAELIVKECANIAHIHSEGSELHDEGTLYYYLADIAVKIKEHFGVE
jgi:hypothetical protein